MIDEDQVREMLHRRASAVPSIVVDAPKAARRARRRLLANGAIAVLAAAAIAVATLAGVDAIRSAPVPVDRPTPGPTPFARTNGEVLSFTGSSRAPGDLVAVNPETGKERVLVKDLDGVYSARWSADGRWVAYETATPEGIALWVVGPSQEPRQVAASAGNPHHDGPGLGWMWSPRGAELATIDPALPLGGFVHADGSRLSTIDPVTGKTTDVGSIPLDGQNTIAPVWSPDRTRFVFGARGGVLYSIDVRSGARSLLVRLPGEHLDSVDQIVWSPDGAHIAVMNDLVPGGGRLYVMDADGSNARVLVSDFDPAEGAGLAWSPDATRVAYADGSGPGGKPRIWVAPLDGSAPAEVGSPTAASCEGLRCDGDLTWSPDGSRIAFLTHGSGYVLVSTIDADGSGDAVLIDELTYRSWAGGSYP